MIPFFRRIRKKLADDNKPLKYARYAIGEIVLVVIGILIALQINNWNVEKKSIQKGRDILVDIRENVEFNTFQFQEDIEVTRKVIHSIDIILNNITVTKIYNDSLDKHFRLATYWETSRWKSSGYEAIISHGVEIIQSKELREAIIDLYEIYYPEMAGYTRLAESNFPSILPFWLELIERESIDLNLANQNKESIGFSVANKHKARPFDYQKIVESRMFRSILTFLHSQRIVDVQLRISAIEKNQELIELINKELKSE